MAKGILEVMLIDACDLRNMDFFGKMDPYVLIQYGNQKFKSTVARRQGKCPVWNQKFTFLTEYPEGNKLNHEYKITFTIMDKDTFTKDDFVGESKIYVKDLLSLGVDNGASQIRRTKYRVVRQNKAYHGEIQASVKFTVKDEMDFNDHNDVEERLEAISTSSTMKSSFSCSYFISSFINWVCCVKHV